MSWVATALAGGAIIGGGAGYLGAKGSNKNRATPIQAKTYSPADKLVFPIIVAQSFKNISLIVANRSVLKNSLPVAIRCVVLHQMAMA